MHCPVCNHRRRATDSDCSQCGYSYPISSPFSRNTQSRVYASQKVTTLAILLLIFIYPFGLPFMWASGVFTRRTRWIFTLSFLLAIILGFLMIFLWTASPRPTPYVASLI